MSNDKSAHESELNQLHAATAKLFREIIEQGEVIYIAGEPIRTKPSAAMLQAARAFLRDNGIVCQKGHPTRPVGELKKAVTNLLDETLPEDLPKFN